MSADEPARGAVQRDWGDRCQRHNSFECIPPRFLLLLIFLTASVTAVNAQDAKPKCPPPTRVDDVTETIHGTVVSDPYRWLEDQTSPETRAWIDAENACTQSVLAPLPGQDAIAKQLGELIKVDTINLPTERGGKYFYSRRAAAADLFVLYMRRGAHGAEEVLVDPSTMSADHTTSVTFEGFTDDGKLVAYGVRKGGEDEVAIHFLDSDTRKELPEYCPARVTSPAFRSRATRVEFFIRSSPLTGPALTTTRWAQRLARRQDFRRWLRSRQDSRRKRFARRPLRPLHRVLRIGLR